MPWWVAYCEPKREFEARDELLGKGFQVFLPFETVTRRRKLPLQNKFVGRTVDEPLFPRYLFAFADVACRLREVRFVIDVVKSGVFHVPIEVPERVIDRLRAFAGEKGLLRSWSAEKLSDNFGAKEGDNFKFNIGDGDAFGGIIGRLGSLARLDSTGVVKAFIRMLGVEREVEISHTRVGQVVDQDALIAA